MTDQAIPPDGPPPASGPAEPADHHGPNFDEWPSNWWRSTPAAEAGDQASAQPGVDPSVWPNDVAPVLPQHRAGEPAPPDYSWSRPAGLPGPPAWPVPGSASEPDEWNFTGSWHYRPEHALAPARHLAQPGGSGSGWRTVVATTATLVTLAVVAAVVVNQFATSAPPRLVTAPSGAAAAKPSATKPGKQTAAPEPTMPTEPLAILTQNPVYALKVTAKCPEQDTPKSSAGFRKQVSVLVECQNQAWRKALAATPIRFTEPEIKHYGDTLKTPCGQLDETFPASYCTADQTLYFSKAAFSQGRYYRLAVAEFVIHEYAHHIQRLAGIFENTAAMKERDATISRRIELQAHCLAQRGLTHSGFSFTEADRSDQEYQFGYTSDPEGHGSAKAERYWGRRGMDAKTVGACNTWTAKADRVK